MYASDNAYTATLYSSLRTRFLLSIAAVLVWVGDYLGNAGRRIQRAEAVLDDAFDAIDPKSDLGRFSAKCQSVARMTGKARQTAAKQLLTYVRTQGNPSDLQRVFYAALSDAN